jgi:hypothetical protein
MQPEEIRTILRRKRAGATVARTENGTERLLAIAIHTRTARSGRCYTERTFPFGSERTARVVAGILMGLCGLLGPGLAGTPVGLIIVAAGGMTLLTGFFGFCPACAMVGRKLKAETARDG